MRLLSSQISPTIHSETNNESASRGGLASRARSARKMAHGKMRWKVRSVVPHFLVIVSVSVKPGEHLQQPGNNGEHGRKRQLFLMPALPGSHVMGTRTAAARQLQLLEPRLHLLAVIVCRWSLCRDCVTACAELERRLEPPAKRATATSETPKTCAALYRPEQVQQSQGPGRHRTYRVVAARDGSSSQHFLRSGPSAFERPKVRAQTRNAQPATTLTHRKRAKVWSAGVDPRPRHRAALSASPRKLRSRCHSRTVNALYARVGTNKLHKACRQAES
ncbi:hypothetical protein L1887_62109 [Cichorium endivia]|nr:hypothetical protein L1887_62109 [Cichorium endivia]